MNWDKYYAARIEEVRLKKKKQKDGAKRANLHWTCSQKNSREIKTIPSLSFILFHCTHIRVVNHYTKFPFEVHTEEKVMKFGVTGLGGNCYCEKNANNDFRACKRCAVFRHSKTITNAELRLKHDVVLVSLYEHGVWKTSCNSKANDDRRMVFVATHFSMFRRAPKKKKKERKLDIDLVKKTRLLKVALKHLG